MGNAVLLISRHSPPDPLLNFYLDRGDTIFVAGPAPAEGDTAAEGYRLLPWNPRSPISARNTLLTLENESVALDEVILIYEHGEESRPLHQIAGSIIDISLDSAIRGTLFIAKEVLNHFDQRGKGELSLILCGYPASVRPTLEASMEGAFREMGSALFQVYRESSIRIRGFEDHREDPKEFYTAICELLRREDEKSWGRWNRPGDRGGLRSYFKRAD